MMRTLSILAVVSMLIGVAPAMAQQTLLRPGLDGDSGALSDPFGEPTAASDDVSQPSIVFAEPIDDGSSSDSATNGDEADGDDDREPADRNGLRGSTGIQRAGDIPSEYENNPRAIPAPRVSLIDASGNITPLANTPVQPVDPEQGGGSAEDDPYAALGIRTGSFTWFPVLTQTFGYTSNADFAAQGNDSAFSQTDVRVSVVSDWSLHELRAEIGGSYQTFFNGTSDDLPVFDGSITYRRDHTRDHRTTVGVNFRRTTESAVSDNLTVPPPAFVTGRPDVMNYEGFAETERRFGRLTARLRGSVERTTYGDADLSTGGMLSQEDRNETLVTGTARLSYETSPSLQPFVEASLGKRVFDQSVDRNGNRRDSFLYGLRGGLAFNRGEKISGELAVGYAAETFDDPALETLGGVTIDGNIDWSPERFTTISVTAQTSFVPSTDANEAGSLVYAASLGITRDVRANLSLNARVLASLRQFNDSSEEDRTLQATAGATWRLNRNTAIVGEVGYETVDSTEPDSSYDAYTARIGLRLQR